jgi:hypothetical protein
MCRGVVQGCALQKYKQKFQWLLTNKCSMIYYYIALDQERLVDDTMNLDN